MFVSLDRSKYIVITIYDYPIHAITFRDTPILDFLLFLDVNELIYILQKPLVTLGMKHFKMLFEIFKHAIIVKFLCCFCTCQSFSILVLSLQNDTK